MDEKAVKSLEEKRWRPNKPWNWIISLRLFKTLTQRIHISEKTSRCAGTQCSIVSCSPNMTMCIWSFPTTSASPPMPGHTRQRTLMMKTFTPRMIETFRPSVQKLVDELIDQRLAQGSMDLVADLAYPLPSNVILDLLGIPRSGRPYIKARSAT